MRLAPRRQVSARLQQTLSVTGFAQEHVQLHQMSAAKADIQPEDLEVSVLIKQWCPALWNAGGSSSLVCFPLVAQLTCGLLLIPAARAWHGGHPS